MKYVYSRLKMHGYCNKCYQHLFQKAMDDSVKPAAWYTEHLRAIQKCTEIFGPPTDRDDEGRWCHTSTGIALRDDRDVLAFRLVFG